jgi:hypothetical protein
MRLYNNDIVFQTPFSKIYYLAGIVAFIPPLAALSDITSIPRHYEEYPVKTFFGVLIMFIYSIMSIDFWKQHNRTEYIVVYQDDCLLFHFLSKPIIGQTHSTFYKLDFSLVDKFELDPSSKEVKFVFYNQNSKPQTIPMSNVYDINKDDQGYHHLKVSKKFKNSSSEIIDFLNQRVQECKMEKN